MIKHSIFFLFSVYSFCFADLTPYLKKDIGDKAKNTSIKNIDAIYLINLDHRKEKLEKVTRQLDPYGISPYRLPAIFGWGLPPTVLNDVAMKYEKGMVQGKWVFHYIEDKGYFPMEELLSDKFYGKRCFSTSMTPGGVGCYLSHLSALQNAYDQGYETVLILEDDICVEANPHLLGDYIDKLDSLVSVEGWDVLYTGFDQKNQYSYKMINDFTKDLTGMYLLWRPDIDFSDQAKYAKRILIGEDFIKVGSRLQACSMIYRRSGIEKILNFVHKHHLFLPWDLELHVIPDMQFFTLRHTIISDETQISDTQENWFSPQSKWNEYQSKVLENLSKMSKQTDVNVARQLLSFIHEKKPQKCVEIGAYGGSITYPLAMGLKYQNKGMLYAIENWEGETKNHISLNQIFENFQDLLKKTETDTRCIPINQKPQDSASSFENQSIDVLILNHTTSEEDLYRSVELYFPKIKKQGFLWVLDPLDPMKGKSIGFLMKHCSWIKDEARGSGCVLFRKEE